MPLDSNVPTPNACIIDSGTIKLYPVPEVSWPPLYNELNLEVWDDVAEEWVTAHEGITKGTPAFNIALPVTAEPGVQLRYSGDKWLYIMEEGCPGDCLRVYGETEVLNRFDKRLVLGAVGGGDPIELLSCTAWDGLPSNSGFRVPDDPDLFPPGGNYTVRILDTETGEYYDFPLNILACDYPSGESSASGESGDSGASGDSGGSGSSGSSGESSPSGPTSGPSDPSGDSGGGPSGEPSGEPSGPPGPGDNDGDGWPGGPGGDPDDGDPSVGGGGISSNDSDPGGTDDAGNVGDDFCSYTLEANPSPEDPGEGYYYTYQWYLDYNYPCEGPQGEAISTPMGTAKTQGVKILSGRKAEYSVWVTLWKEGPDPELEDDEQICTYVPSVILGCDCGEE